MAIQSLELLIQMSRFNFSSEQLLASGNTTTGGTFSVHIAAGLATEKKR